MTMNRMTISRWNHTNKIHPTRKVSSHTHTFPCPCPLTFFHESHKIEISIPSYPLRPNLSNHPIETPSSLKKTMDNPNDERDRILDDLSEYNNELFHTEYLNRNIPRDEIPDRMDRVFDESLDLIMYLYTVVHEHRDNYHYQQRIRRNYERNQHRRAQQATQGQPPAVEVVAPPFGLAYLAKPKVTALKKSDSH